MFLDILYVEKRFSWLALQLPTKANCLGHILTAQLIDQDSGASQS